MLKILFMSGRIILTSRPLLRSRGRAAGIVVFDFDRLGRILRRDRTHELPRLTRQESLVLELLIDFAPRPAAFAEIEDRLWPSDGPDNSGQRIRELIQRLRAVLADVPAKPHFIETVRGVGYAFVGKVEWYDEPLASDSSRSEEDGASAPDPAEVSPVIPLEATQDISIPDGKREVESQGGMVGPVAIAIMLIAATVYSPYGLGVAGFGIGAIAMALGYSGGKAAAYTRPAVAFTMIMAMSYIPSAASMNHVMNSVINIKTLKPAGLYPFITGLKFIPLFVLAFGCWIAEDLLDDRSFRNIRGFRTIYAGLGILFLTATGLLAGQGSADYRIWHEQLSGWRTVAWGQMSILLANIAAWLAMYFRARDGRTHWKFPWLLIPIYLPVAFAGFLVDQEYNEINKFSLHRRRPTVYAAANPDYARKLTRQIPPSLRDEVGPDLKELLSEADFQEALKTQKFYKQDFDEAFQLGHRAVMYGYRKGVGTADAPQAFCIIRFPQEMADVLGFRPVMERE